MDVFKDSVRFKYFCILAALHLYEEEEIEEKP